MLSSFDIEAYLHNSRSKTVGTGSGIHRPSVQYTVKLVGFLEAVYPTSTI